MSIPKIPPEFDELSTSQKVEWVQRLWERISETDSELELTTEERDELDRRLNAHERDPTDVVSWEDLKRDLQKD